jgi:hypothetical protein
MATNIRIGRQQGYLGNLQLETEPTINPVIKEGFRTGVDANAVPVDIWDGPTDTYPWPLVQGIPTIVSSDALDAGGQAGANAVLVEGLNDQYEEVQEIVVLNGVTPVSLVNNYFRIEGVTVAAMGDTTVADSNVGNISLTLNADVIGYIIANFGSSKKGGLFTIPGNVKKSYFIQYDVQAQKGQAAGATVHFQTRFSPQDPWLTQDIVEPHNNGGIATFSPVIPPETLVQAKSDVRIRVVATTSNDIDLICKTEVLYYT